jgi:hypothetical protein
MGEAAFRLSRWLLASIWFAKASDRPAFTAKTSRARQPGAANAIVRTAIYFRPNRPLGFPIVLIGPRFALLMTRLLINDCRLAPAAAVLLKAMSEFEIWTVPLAVIPVAFPLMTLRSSNTVLVLSASTPLAVLPENTESLAIAWAVPEIAKPMFEFCTLTLLREALTFDIIAIPVAPLFRMVELITCNSPPPERSSEIPRAVPLKFPSMTQFSTMTALVEVFVPVGRIPTIPESTPLKERPRNERFSERRRQRSCRREC